MQFQFKKYKNKNKLSIQNRYGILYEKFSILNNTLKRNTFRGKGKYRIPVKIIKSNSNNDYQIKLSIKYRGLDTNKIYFADYHLLKIYDEKIWTDKVKIEKKLLNIVLSYLYRLFIILI